MLLFILLFGGATLLNLTERRSSGAGAGVGNGGPTIPSSLHDGDWGSSPPFGHFDVDGDGAGPGMGNGDGTGKGIRYSYADSPVRHYDDHVNATH